MTEPSGLVVVDKPGGLTSHDVVARLRRILRTRKIGHAGTLDPLATGVLVCGVGRGTKLLGHLALDTKAYLATIRLGATTTTDDAEGEVVAAADAGGVPDAAVAAGIAALTGPKPLADAGWSPDGRTLATAGADGAVTFWNSDGFAQRARFGWKLGPLSAVAFAPDGLTCAAGAGGGRVVWWDVDG